MEIDSDTFSLRPCPCCGNKLKIQQQLELELDTFPAESHSRFGGKLPEIRIGAFRSGLRPFREQSIQGCAGISGTYPQYLEFKLDTFRMMYDDLRSSKQAKSSLSRELKLERKKEHNHDQIQICLLYTSDAADE